MIQILYILIITSIACSLLGVFLLLRNMAMLSDAISHSVLLGIVLAFFVTKDLSSIYLIIAASISGLISCICMELLAKSRKISKDAAVGIVFTFFFSLAVILISKYAKNAHLDVDMVLMGELILAPFDRIMIANVSVPRSLLLMSVVLVINIIYLLINFRSLSISSFDEIYAKTVGINISILYYVFMTMVSMTAVAAFDTVGAILSISFFIAPAASAYLITKKIKSTILISVIYAIINSIVAYVLAINLNVSISGMCATVSCINFLLTFVLYKDGFITKLLDYHRKRLKFRDELLILHIGQHSKGDTCVMENGISSIEVHIAWSSAKLRAAVKSLISKNYIYEDKEKSVYMLTDKGIEFEKKLKKDYGI